MPGTINAFILGTINAFIFIIFEMNCGCSFCTTRAHVGFASRPPSSPLARGFPEDQDPCKTRRDTSPKRRVVSTSYFERERKQAQRSAASRCCGICSSSPLWLSSSSSSSSSPGSGSSTSGRPNSRAMVWLFGLEMHQVRTGLQKLTEVTTELQKSTGELKKVVAELHFREAMRAAKEERAERPPPVDEPVAKRTKLRIKVPKPEVVTVEDSDL